MMTPASSTPSITEATVDLMRLAGLKECGLCCEIMADDGSMMRGEDLKKLAEQLGITFITIPELVEYRKVYDKLVECVQEAGLTLPT